MEGEHFPSGWTTSSAEAVHQLRPNAQGRWTYLARKFLLSKTDCARFIMRTLTNTTSLHIRLVFSTRRTPLLLRCHEMVAKSCTIQFFSVGYGVYVLVFNARFLRNMWEYDQKSYRIRGFTFMRYINLHWHWHWHTRVYGPSCNWFHVVQSHSRSLILEPMESL